MRTAHQIRPANAFRVVSVVDVDDKPIPRLFEAGTLGSIFGNVYPTFGGNVGGMVMAHGRIAGRNAAAMKP